MDDIILKVENISKQYRLGVIGTGTISHDLNRWWSKIRGKEDPYLKIGDTNDRSVKGKNNYVWALEDISFEIKKGEILGVIGKNGAGKSTLLKILSKVTSPSTGIIKSRGRIASLLEVGTGFHPELTGRENIFLNGAILGMTKPEIKSKLDEIIDFSGCMRYIDTPVKRYSSGMKVRLAFAVAAHLEPEILVVDEVLAVGDAEFQKKAIGKMQDISKGEGRTVIFVSHDMDAMLKLTKRCILLENGRVKENGATGKVVSKYLSDQSVEKSTLQWEKEDAPGNQFAKLLKVSVLSDDNSVKFNFDLTEKVFIEFEYLDLNEENKNTAILHIINEFGTTLFASNEFDNPEWESYHDQKTSKIITKCAIPGNFLSEGMYSVLVAVGSYNPSMVHVKIEGALNFRIINNPDILKTQKNVGGKWPGLIRPMLKWTIEKEGI
ncbi:ATP-binding cassette domain-containing protein [Flavobacteriaceae bacterium R38]|nr:ATP-binding cassette domain-containing protein [Flavobacteriaceae bacterium R38]